MVNMTAARVAIETLYDGTCTVTEHQPYTKPNKSTGYQDVDVLIGIGSKENADQAVGGVVAARRHDRAAA